MIKNKIIDEIQKRKRGISLEKFIDICLFDNEGYYETSNPLGKSGDFITSPEISQLFGEILGLYIYSLWNNKYKEKFKLIELGPGNGTLLIDILRITKPLVNFHDFFNIKKKKKNKYLINKQKQNLRLSNFDNINIRWHDDFINIDQRPSIIYANEFFDCLPIRQFIKKDNSWYEKNVNFDQKTKFFYYQHSLVNNEKILNKLAKYKKNNIVELSEHRENFFKKICDFVSKSSGSIIIIDYGYSEFLKKFTLQSVFNHRPSNLLDNLGKQDITSLVDFNTLIDIAKNYNLNVDIFCNQKEFLLTNGILERKNKIIKNCTIEQKKNFADECNRLDNEKQMGAFFKF
jgi:cyclopropane-fatty-acyl-phospholipid synthase